MGQTLNRSLLGLMTVRGLGPVTLQRLLNVWTAEQCLQLLQSELVEAGYAPALASAMRRPDWCAVDRALSWAAGANRRLLPITSVDYPVALKQIDYPPLLLFCEGQGELLSRPQLAIVGSRNPSHYGRRLARRFAEDLADLGWVITSGLALGIDSLGHQGALAAGGATVAVMATGPDRIYPSRHKALAEQIRASGLLVSEFWPGTPAKAEHFPRRNRIISGLARGTLVIEAALKSGSLISARYALEQGREVFAVPGNIDNPMAAGCHWLIKQGAKLVETPADIMAEFPAGGDLPVAATAPAAGDKVIQPQLPFDDLLDSVAFEASTIDVIAERSRLPVETVLSRLIELELHGLVAAVPGGYVRLKRG